MTLTLSLLLRPTVCLPTLLLLRAGAMIALDVVLQTDIMIEALLTLLALEGPLPCVEAHVGLKVARLVEGLLADLAHVGLLPFVNNHVPLQMVFVRKFFVTSVADVSIQVAVGS